MVKLLSILILTLLISGCTDKLILVKPPCFNMKKIEQPTPRTIRVNDEYVSLYKAYIDEFRGKIDNQNYLIEKMNSDCTKWELTTEIKD